MSRALRYVGSMVGWFVGGIVRWWDGSLIGWLTEAVFLHWNW